MTIPVGKSFRKIRDEIIEEKASRYKDGRNLWTGESLEDSLIFGAKVDSIDSVELLPSHVDGLAHEVERE